LRVFKVKLSTIGWSHSTYFLKKQGWQLMYR